MFLWQFFSKLWPTFCCICQELNEQTVCRSCVDKISLDQSVVFSKSVLRCFQCACLLATDSNRNDHQSGSSGLVSNEMICGSCLRTSPQYDRTLTFASYVSPYADLVKRLKYQKDLTVIRTLSEWLFGVVNRCTSLDLGFTPSQRSLIVPVPAHQKRIFHRGFSHTALLAQELSKRCQLPMALDVVIKVRDTPPQAQLPYRQRHKNLKDTFAIRNIRKLENVQKVVLVDDVMTTGATLNEIGGVLKRYGVQYVENWVVLRA